MKWKSMFAALAILAFGSCSKDSGGGAPIEKPDPETPAPNETGKQVLVWVDARSNVFGTYGKFNSKEEIVKILDILKDCGVTGLVIDVKPSSGYTMYNSAYAKEFTSLDGKSKPTDYVEFLIKEAKRR